MGKKIIVSACLAGINCRYDGNSEAREDIIEMVKKGEAIPVCPEQLGNLPTPRNSAEIKADRVIDLNGNDLTLNYQRGAANALKVAQLTNCKRAILKSKSPMCGHKLIYDGQFAGKLVEGHGIFSSLLIENGFEITSLD